VPLQTDSAARRATGGFADKTCTAPAERSDRMRDIVLAHVPRDRAIRLLDVGCGTGSLLFRLAEALPVAVLSGVDISSANIRAARAQQAGRPAAVGVRFETADYLDYVALPFDAIVTDGVLHLIPGDTATLVRKLASDLVPGGFFFCSMPFDCVYNRAFAGVRRGLRAVRSSWLDQLILKVGRLLHGAEMDDERLRERVDYMYIAPERMMSKPLAACFASVGLRGVATYPMESTSPSQLKHQVTVFVRESDEALRQPA
jgi:2-polyprenyl-3-methyl-5-hydroxy-6-metoxy-1,4-benzoquinol methylase